MLVSAIMPTRGRPQYAIEAVECFLSQAWYEKELVVVDDEDDPSFKDNTLGEYLRGRAVYDYTRLINRRTIGAKRNLACSRANGDVIVHFDSDDVCAPGRIVDQLSRLTRDINVTGYSSMKFLDVATGEWWKYNGHSRYALGTSLMYWRAYWNTHRFPDSNKEDAEMCHRARNTTDAGEMMWARTHADNTSARKGMGKMSEWVKVA